MANTFTTINMTTGLNAAALESLINFSDKYNAANTFTNLIDGMAAGVHASSLTFNIGATQATGKLVLTGEPTVGSSFIVANGTFTANGSTTNGSTFAVGTSVTATAANIVSAIGSSANGIVTATSTAGTVNFTAVQPGISGNGIGLSTNLGSSTVTGFSGATNGTVNTIDLGL